MPAALAKLTPPRLMRVIVRERLHRLLDGGVRAPAVWFGAAAGSGKTTAAAEFLAARKASVCWYRVDAGDLDLASFFFYLARVAPIARSKKALPVFGPEFSEQPVPFARRFFRDLYSRLPAESAVVFDDLHVAAATLLPAIVAIAIEELPPDFRLFLLSREQAPATFAGFRATDRLGVIDEDSLRFDEEETSAFIRRRIGTAVDQDTQQRLRTGARGWAAGLVLLSEQAARGTSAAAQIRVRPGQILFDYFGREVFGCMEEADQHFMEFTALLSEFTAKAAAIIALRDDAQSVVDDLCRRQLFVTRIADRPPRYLYHDLFRAFLLERLQGRLDADLLNAARLRAADAALADDRPDQAITLCLDGGDFDRATDLLCAQAPSLIQQGRRATLRSFAQRIPVAIATRQPWLDYWLGVAGMVDDHTVALKHFERAHVEFTASNDMPAVCLNAAQALLAIHLSWVTSVGGIAWVKRLLRSATAATELAPGHQLRVTAALLRAAAMDETYRVNEEGTAVVAESALKQLEGTAPDIDVNDRLLAADALQEHAMTTGQRTLFERTVAAVTPHLSNSSLTSWAKCHWLISFGTVSGRRYPYQKTGFPYSSAAAALQDAWSTCEREGFSDLRFAATMALINVARAAGDDEQARTLVARLDAECNPARPTQVYALMDQKAAQFAGGGHYAEALKANDAALDAAGRAQLPLGELWSGWMTNAEILIALNRCKEAAAFMREHASEFSGVFRQAMEIIAASAEAWAARRDGGPDYVARLRKCMAEVRAMGWTNYMTGIPAIVAHLWSDALEHGIEREFIVAAVRLRRLAPPARYAPAWPWRVRVRVLGRIEIECDDAPIRFGAKAQLKPLELLKVLAAAPQHEMHLQQVQSWLWPDADGGAAKAALEVAVHRLRKLLHCDEAVRVVAGKMRLSPEHVWVDASAFESWVDDAQRKLVAQQQAPAADLLAERLFADYRGPLFGDDPSTPWSIGPRERLHNRFLGLVGGLGRFHEVGKDWGRAVMVYERGLAQDQLAEEFYRGLIRCQLAQNEAAAAMHTFRRCRDILSVVLGIAPAPATRALIAKIAAAGV